MQNCGVQVSGGKVLDIHVDNLVPTVKLSIILLILCAAQKEVLRIELQT